MYAENFSVNWAHCRIEYKIMLELTSFFHPTMKQNAGKCFIFAKKVPCELSFMQKNMQIFSAALGMPSVFNTAALRTKMPAAVASGMPISPSAAS